MPPADLLSTAQSLARRYANKPPVAVQMIKQSVNRIVSALDQAIMHMDVDQNLYAQTSDDRNTAIKAYLDGTNPTFSGN